VADWSVSVPMTVSDFKWRDAMDQTLPDDLLELCTNRLTESDQIRQGSTDGWGVCSYGDRHASHSKGAGSASPNLLRPPYWRPYGLTSREGCQTSSALLRKYSSTVNACRARRQGSHSIWDMTLRDFSSDFPEQVGKTCLWSRGVPVEKHTYCSVQV